MKNESLMDLKRNSIKDTPKSEPTTDNVVQLMEKEWPEMTKEFKKLQREQYELFCHKQHDYGPGNISVGCRRILSGVRPFKESR